MKARSVVTVLLALLVSISLALSFTHDEKSQQTPSAKKEMKSCCSVKGEKASMDCTSEKASEKANCDMDKSGKASMKKASDKKGCCDHATKGAKAENKTNSKPSSETPAGPKDNN